MTIIPEKKVHGAAIASIFEALGGELPELRFSLKRGVGRSSYVIDGLNPINGSTASSGIYIKVSNKRRSPWSYSYTLEHQKEVADLATKFCEVFSIFGAGDDGFACLDYRELKEILDENFKEVEWVRVSRKHRENYRVSGNDGAREQPLARNSFPGKIVEYFQTTLIRG